MKIFFLERTRFVGLQIKTFVTLFKDRTSTSRLELRRFTAILFVNQKRWEIWWTLSATGSYKDKSEFARFNLDWKKTGIIPVPSKLSPR